MEIVPANKPPPVAEQPAQPPRYNAPPNPGKIADYDPLQGRGGGPHTPYSARQSSTVIYTSDRGPGTSYLLIVHNIN